MGGQATKAMENLSHWCIFFSLYAVFRHTYISARVLFRRQTLHTLHSTYFVFPRAVITLASKAADSTLNQKGWNTIHTVPLQQGPLSHGHPIKLTAFSLHNPCIHIEASTC